MKEEEILDSPVPISSKSKRWKITLFCLLSMTFFLLLKFPFTIFITSYFRSPLIYHFLFFVDLLLIGLPLYLLIKKIDLHVHDASEIFIWSSFITTLSSYISSILDGPLAYLYSFIFPGFMHGSIQLDLYFDTYHFTVGILHGGFLSFGFFIMVKDNNKWFLSLIILFLWGFCYFLDAPYIIDF